MDGIDGNSRICVDVRPSEIEALETWPMKVGEYQLTMNDKKESLKRLKRSKW
jgi:hypothetical protein